jgi:TRAP-type uncharacterized transport system substrate-binding protein
MSTNPGRGWASRRPVPPLLVLVAILVGLGWLAWRKWLRPEVRYDLRITGGKAPGPRHRIARLLRSEAFPGGVDLTISELPGSIEALDEVNDQRVEVALVQGAIDSRRWTNLRQVAALYVEPLQLVVRSELVVEAEANLRALQGHSINLGEVGSGSNALAREVLAFVGLGDKDYTAGTLSHRELLAIEDRERLPDALMTVSSLPTPVVGHLVAKWGYRLVPLRFGEAFVLEDLGRKADNPRGDRSGPRAVINRAHLHETSIPEYTYGVNPAVPAARLATFGARVLVVAHREVPAEAVRRLLEAIFLGKFAQVARPPLDPSLLGLPAEFPLHEGTVEFLQRNKPMVADDAMQFLVNTTSLTGAVLGGLFVTWQSVQRWYRKRREQGFEFYLLKVTEVERRALQHELAAQLDLPALVALQADLGRIKDEAIRRFTRGELEGEGLMSGFLTHANDARDYLARLILHARTAIEKRARHQGLSPEAVWGLAFGESEPPEPGLDPGHALPTEGRVL